MLAQKWRIFFRPIANKVETTTLIVKTACVLHNFLRAKQCDNQYCELQPPDQPSQQARSLTWKLIQNGQQIWHLVYEKNLLNFLMINK